MNIASLNEIKKEISTLDSDALVDLCLRLAKYKNENKELLSYMLFEAHDEKAFVENVKEELQTLFQSLPTTNVYFIKKSLRKILRFANKQIKYSGIKKTELELRLFFCTKMKEAQIPLPPGTVLFNLYQQQLRKIESALNKLSEDLQGDYEREVNYLMW